MKLSIQTPWGQVRPLFVPIYISEGVRIGNAYLQRIYNVHHIQSLWMGFCYTDFS
jgi:hypothetical protein